MTTIAITTRPLIIGPDTGPEPPFPLRMQGPVISGFGRGSKELGIPTANLPVDDDKTPTDASLTQNWLRNTPSGVYFGWASIALPEGHPDRKSSEKFELFPMVMSIGYNPFYKNTVRSAEVHVLHEFKADFYGAQMKLLLLDFVREEKNYEGLEALVSDIRTDCEVARRSLERKGWAPRTVAKGGHLDVGWLMRDD